jgi:hypothetical protein
MHASSSVFGGVLSVLSSGAVANFVQQRGFVLLGLAVVVLMVGLIVYSLSRRATEHSSPSEKGK